MQGCSWKTFIFLVILIISGCAGGTPPVETLKVIYDGNGSTGGSVPIDSTSYETGYTVTVLDNTGNLVKAGYAFTGWNTEAGGGGTTYTVGQTFAMGSSDVTLYARWTTNPTYTVTYDGNGNTGGTAPADLTNYETGQTVTVFDNTGDLVKEGNSFVGWNTEAGGGGTTYTVGQTFAMGSSDVTLYARWTTNPTYTVTYDGNGNTGGAAPVDLTNYETGQTVTILGNTGNLVKAGSTFAGWNTEAGGGGTNYAAGQTFAMGASDVTLYAKWQGSDADFMIVIMPDTQSYVAWKNSILISQVDWLVANAGALNLKFVAHVGDLVQNYDTNLVQWGFIQTQMDRLAAADIPYSTLPGNHDYKQNTRDSTVYNDYFPLSYFEPFDTYGGSYDTASDNMYHLVDTGNDELLILSLEFGPRDAVVTWADGVLNSYPDTLAIVVTHAYLKPDGELLAPGDDHAASNGYGLGVDVNDGTELWSNLIYPNNNVLFVNCGHDGSVDDGAGLRTSEHADKSPVYQVLSNYQYFPWSDSGYLLLLGFSPANGIVHMHTYSPYLDRYKSAPDTEADFPY